MSMWGMKEKFVLDSCVCTVRLTLTSIMSTLKLDGLSSQQAASSKYQDFFCWELLGTLSLVVTKCTQRSPPSFCMRVLVTFKNYL